MNKSEFERKVLKAVKERVGSEYDVMLNSHPKNNGICIKGVVITGDNIDVSPIIPLDYYYIAYKMGGMTLAQIIESLLDFYLKKSAVAMVDFDFFKEFENVKQRICYRLINKDMNEELLSDIPHRDFLDMAVCLYYSYEGEMGSGSILIWNSHIEMWGTDEDTLFALAEYNTPKLFQWKSRTVDEVFVDLGINEPVPRGGDFMTILSNTTRNYGAAVMRYKGVVRQLANGQNLYILPASIHEVILLHDTNCSPDDLRKMIHEVNETQVSPLEVLSDSLYFYDSVKDKIIICE